jgi:hypothetical protein
MSEPTSGISKNPAIDALSIKQEPGKEEQVPGILIAQVTEKTNDLAVTELATGYTNKNPGEYCEESVKTKDFPASTFKNLPEEGSIGHMVLQADKKLQEGFISSVQVPRGAIFQSVTSETRETLLEQKEIDKKDQLQSDVVKKFRTSAQIVSEFIKSGENKENMTQGELNELRDAIRFVKEQNKRWDLFFDSMPQGISSSTFKDKVMGLDI